MSFQRFPNFLTRGALFRINFYGTKLVKKKAIIILGCTVNQTYKKKRKQNVEIDSPASSGGQRKHVQYVKSPWSPPEAALPICNFSVMLNKTF